MKVNTTKTIEAKGNVCADESASVTMNLTVTVTAPAPVLLSFAAFAHLQVCLLLHVVKNCSKRRWDESKPRALNRLRSSLVRGILSRQREIPVLILRPYGSVNASRENATSDPALCLQTPAHHSCPTPQVDP